jgi:hypothetical protein
MAEVDSTWNSELASQWKRQLQPCIDAMSAAHKAEK